MGKRTREVIKNEQAAKRKAQRQKQMQNHTGTSSYALKKAEEKRNGIRPSSPFFQDRTPLPVATPLPPQRPYWESWWR